jgi:hypothetical protein
LAGIDRALDWPAGFAERVLAGKATEDEIRAAVRAQPATVPNAPKVLTVEQLLRRLRELNKDRSPEEDRLFAAFQDAMPEILGGKYNPPSEDG